MLATLKRVWAFAICRGVSDARRSIPDKPSATGEMATTHPASWSMNAHPDQDSQDIKKDVDQCGLKSLPGLSKGGQEGRHTGSDIGTEGQGNASRERNETLGRQDNDHPGGRGGGLNQGCKEGPDQDPQNRGFHVLHQIEEEG